MAVVARFRNLAQRPLMRLLYPCGTGEIVIKQITIAAVIADEVIE
jgi:hypothetical protein